MSKGTVPIQKSDSVSNVAKIKAPRPRSSSSFLPLSQLQLVTGLQRITHTTKPLVQPKLNIGQPHDEYEREADRVADQVMRVPARQVSSLPGNSDPKIQRQNDEEEEEKIIQTKPIEKAITPVVQRQTEEEEDEEEVQAKPVAGMVQRQTDEEEEEELVQPKAQGDGKGLSCISTSKMSFMQNGGSRLPGSTKRFFESRLGYDFSGVRIHTGNSAVHAAESVHARAFTLGPNIVFGAGQFQPDSQRGRHLLAHELTHVVQQNSESVRRKSELQITPLASRRIQARRIPPPADISGLVRPGRHGVHAHRAGLAQLVARAMAELNPTQRAAVRTRARGALSVAQFSTLLSWQRNQRLARAIYQLHPTLLRHGDPSLYMTGPRPATNDAAHINTLVARANTHFAAVAAGSRNASINQVFGAGNLATVKARYARARSRMNILHGRNRIVSDRSGYSGEVGLGGLTNANRIMLSPRAIDNPSRHSSIAAMVHESMHAGNPGVVGDRGYIYTATIFTRMSVAAKLRNAAHYEVPIWRVLNPAHSYAYSGQTFTPAGTGATAPLTTTQRGVRMASERFRKAWTAGLWLHGMYIDVHERPGRWTLRLAPRYSGAHANARYRNTLPYWSKVEKTTTYRRMGTILHTSPDASRRPVSRIDVALSEGVVRKINRGMRSTPRTQAAAQSFITANASPAQRTRAAGNAARTRNLLLRLVVQRRIGGITGGIRRDLAVLRRLAWAYSGGYRRLLRPRHSNRFPYS